MPWRCLKLSISSSLANALACDWSCNCTVKSQLRNSALKSWGIKSNHMKSSLKNIPKVYMISLLSHYSTNTQCSRQRPASAARDSTKLCWLAGTTRRPDLIGFSDFAWFRFRFTMFQRYFQFERCVANWIKFAQFWFHMGYVGMKSVKSLWWIDFRRPINGLISFASSWRGLSLLTKAWTTEISLHRWFVSFLGNTFATWKFCTQNSIETFNISSWWHCNSTCCSPWDKLVPMAFVRWAPPSAAGYRHIPSHIHGSLHGNVASNLKL